MYVCPHVGSYYIRTNDTIGLVKFQPCPELSFRGFCPSSEVLILIGKKFRRWQDFSPNTLLLAVTGIRLQQIGMLQVGCLPTARTET